MRTAAQQGRHQAVWVLAWSMASYHWRRSRLTEDLAFWQAALTATEAIGKHVLTARRFLGRALTRLGLSEEALQQLTTASKNDDPHERAPAFHTLAWYWERNGDDSAALADAQRALALFEQLGAQASTAKAYNAVGWYLARLGDFEHARQHCERALELSSDREPEVRYGLYDSLGFIACEAGDYAAASEYYQQELALIREMGNIYEEPNVLVDIGRVSLRSGDADGARRSWLAAIGTYAAQSRLNEVERVQRLLDALDES